MGEPTRRTRGRFEAMHIFNSPNAIPGLSARPSSEPKNLFGDTLWNGINGEIRCARHAGYSPNNKPTKWCCASSCR